ncbi:uncharacterized protein KIAA1143 homolog isoform X2 [Brachionichthys hirsutus]|uniref:uncharacterized protein KIAA1143 homolog isoform X2 n=1 Tax=Brachionichthys hirsutus TaxID=412623 RepID=UPI003604E7D8
MNKNKARGVSWVRPAEPAFLKKFKDDVGYKEAATVDTKRQVTSSLDDDTGSDPADELPQVVVVQSGDLTGEDAQKIRDEMRARGGEDDGPPPDGKILFKKPAKRSSDTFQGITASTSKKKKTDGGDKDKDKSERKVKNNSLLSFGGDEEEEED